MLPTVVHVLNGLGLGGNETLCLQIVRHAPPGVANVVIYQDPARAELLPLFEGVPGLRLRCVPTHGRLRLVGAWLLAKEIRRLRPVAVLIYAFGLHHLFMAAAARPSHSPHPPPVQPSAGNGRSSCGCPPLFACRSRAARLPWNDRFGS